MEADSLKSQKSKNSLNSELPASPSGESPLQDPLRVFPFFRTGSYLLLLFCLALFVRSVLGIFFGDYELSTAGVLFAWLVVALPALFLAEIWGTHYLIGSDYIERRGFFGGKKRLEWGRVTQVTLTRPVAYGRGVIVKAGKQSIRFSLGIIWWRRGFFKAAEKIMAMARSRSIPLAMKWPLWGESSRDTDFDYWLSLGREGLFPWAKAQLSSPSKGSVGKE